VIHSLKSSGAVAGSISSHILSSTGIQLGARWQFCTMPHVIEHHMHTRDLLFLGGCSYLSADYLALLHYGSAICKTRNSVQHKHNLPHPALSCSMRRRLSCFHSAVFYGPYLQEYPVALGQAFLDHGSSLGALPLSQRNAGQPV